MHVLDVRQQGLLFCSQSFLKVAFDSLHLCLLCLHEGAADLGQGRIFCYACIIKTSTDMRISSNNQIRQQQFLFSARHRLLYYNIRDQAMVCPYL